MAQQAALDKISSFVSGEGDGKYFQTTRKGEIHELREELRLPNKDKKKEVVKKVIAAMTVGKDVSMLFPDVVNCMQTPDIELKKLVYLYLMNYAKTQPDLAILAVNTFVKDSQDSRALVRALAIRTMGCIRVEKITEYLCEPLRKCLRDDDPYVRKTAAICVAKLYEISPVLVEDQGFIDELKELLSDPNPIVVANAVSALMEISDTSVKSTFTLNVSMVNKLLTAMNECNEWGQVFILDALAQYMPNDPLESESICERATPRLQHANPAVALSAVKVIMCQMVYISNPETLRSLTKKMSPPLVSLMSSPEPEIQYIALRNIDLIVQKRPNALSNEIKIFFCKYNDPLYVKLEKLELIIKLVSDRNFEQVLAELKEYATEVDVEFVRKSVRAIGRCAIKLERATERCIEVLLELIQMKANHIIQEAIIVIKDIFRKFPNKYEGIIKHLFDEIDGLDEPETRAAMVWIIGQYSNSIDNAADILRNFLATFKEESHQVQHQLLTAIVKLYLNRGDIAQEMVQTVLNLSTSESDNPDLRDRGYIYWRLLSIDPEAARAVVATERPTIRDDTNLLDNSLLDELIPQLATLASVYHKAADTFTNRSKVGATTQKRPSAPAEEDYEAEQEVPDIAAGPGGINLLDLDDFIQQTASPSTAQRPATQFSPQPVVQSPPSGIAAPLPSNHSLLDDFASIVSAPVPVQQKVQAKPKTLLLNAEKGKGFVLSGSFVRRNGQPFLDFTFENQSPSQLTSFAIQFNKNSFSIGPSAPLNLPLLMPGQKTDILLALNTSSQNSGVNPPSPNIQMAIKNNTGIVYFQLAFPLHVLYTETGRAEKQAFLSVWRSVPDHEERSSVLSNLLLPDSDQIQKTLERHNIFLVAQRKNESGQTVFYLSSSTTFGVSILFEFVFTTPNSQGKLSLRSARSEWLALAELSFAEILRP